MPSCNQKKQNHRWTANELHILHTHYSTRGRAVAELLPGRSRQSIFVKASHLGLRVAPQFASRAPQLKLNGSALEEAITLRERDNWSFARIGTRFGVAETTASNAVLITLCTRKGYQPAERHPNGRLTDQGIERLQYLLRKGLKGVEISLRLGVSAACVAEQRRRYERYLRSARKVPIPAHGNGDHYSGRKLTRAERANVEQHFLSGKGAPVVANLTGISKTSCGRIRNRLIKRLARTGKTLPGCDKKGRRHTQISSTRFIPPECEQLLRSLLITRTPVARAAKIAAIGASSAYRIRDTLAEELQAEGKTLESPILPGRVTPGAYRDKHWPPQGAKAINTFRAMLSTMSFDEAKSSYIMQEAKDAAHERQRPKSFEEQLALIASGQATLAPNYIRHHLEPLFTEPRNEMTANRRENLLNHHP